MASDDPHLGKQLLRDGGSGYSAHHGALSPQVMRDGGSGYTLDEEKRSGLISAADFGVYLREFGTRPMRLLLIVCTVFSALASVAANLYLCRG